MLTCSGCHQVFYKQLDELQDEYDELRRKGYEGEGFLGKGNRVGLGVGHDTGISLAQAREKSLKKLEEKEKLRRLLGTGGKLGGTAPDMKGKRMSVILADVRCIPTPRRFVWLRWRNGR